MSRSFCMLLKPLLTLVVIGSAVRQTSAAEQPGMPGQAPPAVVRIGETQKICQLTGDIDWETERPTAARTLTNFGLGATDLGYPVEHLGKLIFLFGDSWPPPHGGGPEAEMIPDDAVGETTRTAVPDPETCLNLTIHNLNVRGVRRFEPATIKNSVPVKQGFFNVPSGGVSVRGVLYGFFWTNHCSSPSPLGPAPNHPMERPVASVACPESNSRNSIGIGVMARSNDFGRSFNQVSSMPDGFVYSTAVNAEIQQDLPDEQRLGVFIFGVPRYRASVPYLAYAPLDTFADTATWQFFAGHTPEGRPRWVRRSEWTPNEASQIYVPATIAGYNVGEFSITWNQPLRMWLMMYDGVAIRVAREPWGPWSKPTTILSQADHPGCKLVMTAAGCGNHRDYWPGKRHGDEYQPGGFYAPFVMNRYTRADAGPRRAILYWVLSTWNPYQVSVMRTMIEIPATEGARTGSNTRIEEQADEGNRNLAH